MKTLKSIISAIMIRITGPSNIELLYNSVRINALIQCLSQSGHIDIDKYEDTVKCMINSIIREV